MFKTVVTIYTEHCINTKTNKCDLDGLINILNGIDGGEIQGDVKIGLSREILKTSDSHVDNPDQLDTIES